MRSIHLNLSTATKRDKFIGIALFGLTIYFLVRSFILSWSVDIWYDELFSMEFSSMGVKELVAYTARDVHPPLYYIIVRCFTLLFKGVGLTNAAGGGLVPVETVAKLVSILPFILLIIYAATTIRKHFGILAAGLFSFAVVTMPGLPEYTTEIRMYSWAVFFVTAALLHGFNLVRSMSRGAAKVADGTSKGDGATAEDESAKSFAWGDAINAAAMFVYGVAATYTHYYAAVAVGAVYGIILIWMLKLFIGAMKKKEGKALNFRPLAGVVITMNLVVAAYIPWVSSLLSQVGAVSNNYWIQPVGLRTLGTCAKYMLSAYFVNPKAAAGSAVLLALLIFVIFVHMVARLIASRMGSAGGAAGDAQTVGADGCGGMKSYDNIWSYDFVAFLILPALVGFGIIASILIRPVFVSRYMVPAFGTFWLFVSIGVGNIIREISFKSAREKAVSIAAIFLGITMLVVGVVDFRAFIGNEKYRIVNMEKTIELFDSIDEDTIIISNFEHVQALLSYYLNEKGDAGAYGKDSKVPYSIYLYKAEAEPLIDETVPGLRSIEDSVDIYNYLKAGKKVLFLGSFNSREVLLEEWNKDYGITSENKGSYLMERYWFDVFELAL